MTIPRIAVLCVGIVLSCISSATGDELRGSRPNIILIMSDDMGYSDIGCYGGEIDTPTLDKLASGGLRYTQFYNTGRCCPTRASLLTGLYAHQAGIGEMTNPTDKPGYQGDLSHNAMTLAEVMKGAGYRTYMAGKWHVTKQLNPDGNKENWPRQRGFDRFYGTIIGAGSLYDPYTLTRGNKAITPDNDELYQQKPYYYTNAISDHAVRYVNDHKKDHSDDPFFMYVSYTAAHWPMHALEKDIEKYKGKYDAGYAATRNSRFERMKKMGLIPNAELSKAPQTWDDVPEEQAAWELRCMEVYAAMVDSMDQGIGRLVNALIKNGQYENTLILYLQDNGGCHEAYGRRAPKKPSTGHKPMHKDELQSNIFPSHTRDGRPVRTGVNVMPGPPDTYIAYGKNWANVSNTPFRHYKSMNHEGGIATPLIAHWPKGIQSSNELRQQVGHLIDIMPTMVELANADYPQTHGGNEIKPMEGISLLSSFNKDQNVSRLIMWEHFGNRAIRKGKWKLVARRDEPWELYDMEKDRSELNNQVKHHSDIAESLGATWNQEAERTLVFPKPERKKRKR